MKKKIMMFLSAATLFACEKIMAQTDTTMRTNTSTGYNSPEHVGASRFSWGLRTGVNFSNINGKYSNGDKTKNDILVGWHAGINAEFPLAPDFYFRPEVLFTTAGAKLDNKTLNQVYTTTVHLSYIEIPLNFIYKPLVGSGHVIAGIGPYVDFGIAGKVKYAGTGAPANRDVKFKNKITADQAANYAYYRGLGAGGNLLFGYEFANSISLQLNAQLGLTDINTDYGTSRPKATNTAFGFSVGYRF